MIFYHVCSPESVLSILESGQFYPSNVLPQGGDSCLSGYIRGRSYYDQIHVGNGAALYIDWQGPVEELLGEDEVVGKYVFPLAPDTLFQHRGFRACIPMGTDPENIAITVIQGESQCLNVETVSLKRQQLQSTFSPTG
jgi:hypothetical protein